MDEKPIKNIYIRGAEQGAWLGVYFVVMFALSIGSMTAPVLNLPALAMMVCVPLLTYVALRRTYVATQGMAEFSALWMQGIVMFACGSLILAAVTVVYLQWVNPGFMVQAVNIAIDTYSAADIPEAEALAEALEQMRDNHALPSALNVAMGWVWLGAFSGSLLSLVIAAIVRATKVKTTD